MKDNNQNKHKLQCRNNTNNTENRRIKKIINTTLKDMCKDITIIK